MAPEILLSTGKYEAAGVDVWACGVVLFHMLAGRLPFSHDTNASGVLDHAMMQRIVRGQCVPFLFPALQWQSPTAAGINKHDRSHQTDGIAF
jgi:serine/threonine protein kinase